jgi:hypothetical protein
MLADGVSGEIIESRSIFDEQQILLSDCKEHPDGLKKDLGIHIFFNNLFSSK